MRLDIRQGSGRLVPVSAVGPAPPVRRAEGFAHDRPIGQVPGEIAFLASQGVPPGLLLKAAERARTVGVTADSALLGAGFPEDTFYRLLARHLGMPYLDTPMRLILPPRAGSWNGEPEAAALAPNAQGLLRLLAPRGERLRNLLDIFQAGQGRGTRTAILSPRCLEALIRRQRRPALLHIASHGLASWDETLSAAGGLDAGQQAVGLAAAFAFAVGFVLAPAMTLAILAALTSLIAFAGILVKLAAVAASPAPQPPSSERLPDADLPAYTIVVPLLREARVVPQLIAALDALDYPVLGSKLTKGRPRSTGISAA